MSELKIIEALNAVSKSVGEDVGEMKGEMRGLKSFMQNKTDECKSNYVSLSGHMERLTRKINGVVIEKEVEERVTGKFKRILYNRVTLLCTIIGLAIAFAGIERSHTKKADKRLIKISKELRQIKTANAYLIKEKHND